jgi:hypothetical protein
VLYGRPDHTAAVLDGLIENGVDRVRAFMDYPGGPGVAARQEELLDVIA